MATARLILIPTSMHLVVAILRMTMSLAIMPINISVADAVVAVVAVSVINAAIVVASSSHNGGFAVAIGPGVVGALIGGAVIGRHPRNKFN